MEKSHYASIKLQKYIMVLLLLLSFSMGAHASSSVYNDESIETSLTKQARQSKSMALSLANKGDTAKAYVYAMRYIALSDSLQNVHDKSETSENASPQGFTWPIFIFVILLLIYVIFFILHFTNRRDRKMLKELRQMSEERNEVIKDNKDIQDKVKADMKLRAESAKDISEVKTELQGICDDAKRSLQPDMWDDIFNAVDKLHPHFREQLLSYNSELKNKDLVLIYLMKLGFKQADIARIVKRDPSVIWRKFKRIEGLLGVSVDQALRDNNAATHN